MISAQGTVVDREPESLRILHCSWEYPPIVYGGLGRHIEALTRAQAAAGHEVVVLTQDADRLDPPSGVRVVGAPRDAPHVPLDVEHLLPWVMGFTSGLIRAGLRLGDDWRPDVVHGHDWMVSHASLALATAFSVPYCTTVHATEAGRHQGWLSGTLSQAIHGIEWWSVDMADRVITCSDAMRNEVITLFEPSPERIVVIANGVSPVDWDALQAKRRADRAKDGRPLVVFAGRLEWEKGVHTLIEALAVVRRQIPDVHLVIAGEGSTTTTLREDVRARRLGRHVDFAGWLPFDDLTRLLAGADVVVVPSLYEPFGLVALEAAIVGAPLVVARTGGLIEVVDDPATGWLFEAGDADGLASCVVAALSDPEEARARAHRARALLAERFSWPVIAERTLGVYRAARVDPDRPRPRPSYVVDATGNLLPGQVP